MKRAVFLDRDGTITQEPPHYAHKLSQMKLYPGSTEAIALLNSNNYLVIVISNQAGIARGYYREEDMHFFNEAMKHELAKGKASIDAIYFCPHHIEGSIAEYAIECDCRKPRTGMLEKARKDFEIDMAQSFMVGDRSTDLEAGRKVGCRTILVKTGYGEETSTDSSVEFDHIADNLCDAVQYILENPLRQ